VGGAVIIEADDDPKVAALLYVAACYLGVEPVLYATSRRLLRSSALRQNRSFLHLKMGVFGRSLLAFACPEFRRPGCYEPWPLRVLIGDRSEPKWSIVPTVISRPG
jgi:hypothetical protein